MAKDMGDAVRGALSQAVREAVKNVGDVTPTSKRGGGPLSGARGLAAGAGLAAAAPLAKKGVDAIRANGGIPTPSPTKAAGRVASKAGDKVTSGLKDTVSNKVDEAGGAGGLVKEAASTGERPASAALGLRRDVADVLDRFFYGVPERIAHGITHILGHGTPLPSNR